MGRRPRERRSLLFALLLDAARLDHALLGAHRRITGGDPIWSAEPVDQQLLGRSIGSRGGMSGVRFATEAPLQRSSARCRLVRRWPGPAHADSPVRVHLFIPCGATVFRARDPPPPALQ